MTDIDKRIDEIMDKALECEARNRLPIHCSKFEAYLIEAAEIIKHLQAQVVERERVIAKFKAQLAKTNSVLEKLTGMAIDIFNKAGE